MSILCVTDFSPPALAAADIAARLAGRKKLPLHLLHVASDWIVAGDAVVPLGDEEAVQRRLDAEAERLRKLGISVTAEVRSGVPSMEIVAAASSASTKLIVMGSTGRGGASHWLIGSVAERVAESAPVPTLVVRDPEALRRWLDDGVSLRALCGMDRSAVSGTALATLGTFAELGNLEMEIAVLRSSHDDDFLEEPSIRAQEVTERVREWIGASPAEVHVRDLAEAPARGFLELAGERAAGLLVTGTHQRHGLERLRAPSFSRVILTHGATNVLCVPARAATAIESLPRLQRILVGTDFGASWPDVLRYAKALLPGGGAIHVVHVCPEPKAGINPLIRSAVYFDHCLEIVEIRERAERRIRELPAALRACDGVTLTWEVIANDDVAGALCAEAERVGAGVICLETDRASRLVTSVIDQASVPVFVVKYPIP